MKGRKPTPTRLKVLTGNPGRRDLNQFEPEPLRGIPEMPGWLREFPVAVEEWDRESEILDGIGVMTVAECSLLANRSYLSYRIQRLASEIEKEGDVVYQIRMDSMGNEIADAKSNPKARILMAAMVEHRQLGGLLGLDPSNRAKLSINPKGRKNKFDGLIRDVKK